MEYTFKQSRSQKETLFVIIGSSFLMVGICFLSIFLLGDGPAGMIVSFGSIAAIIATIYFYVRLKTIIDITMRINTNGFTLHEHKTGEEKSFRWDEVTKYKSGEYKTQMGRKHYLWIWLPQGNRNIHVEDTGENAEQFQRYTEFRSAVLIYLQDKGIPVNKKLPV